MSGVGHGDLLRRTNDFLLPEEDPPRSSDSARSGPTDPPDPARCTSTDPSCRAEVPPKSQPGSSRVFNFESSPY